MFATIPKSSAVPLAVRGESKKPERVEAPARLSSAYKRDRILSPVAGAPKGWRNREEHPLSLALDAGQISRDEYDAGDRLRMWLELEHRSGRDSTDIDGPREHGPRGHDYLMWPEIVTDARRGLGDARLALLSLDNGEIYLAIVERFCGGYAAAEACRSANVDRKRTWEMVRLALTKLEVALALVRRPYGQTR